MRPRTPGTRATRMRVALATRRIRSGATEARSSPAGTRSGEFLAGKWDGELDYRLAKALWCFHDNRIAVRFQYEWHDEAGQLVAQLRQRALGVRRARPHAAARGQHQRCRYQRARPSFLLARPRTAAGAIIPASLKSSEIRDGPHRRNRMGPSTSGCQTLGGPFRWPLAGCLVRREPRRFLDPAADQRGIPGFRASSAPQAAAQGTPLSSTVSHQARLARRLDRCHDHAVARVRQLGAAR